jgi:hypothetical protein
MLDGFWTKARFQYSTMPTEQTITSEKARGGWSDIDVLAYHPKSKHLVIAESKAQGRAQDLYAFTGNQDQNFEQYIRNAGSNYLGFLDQIDKICLNPLIRELCPDPTKITVQLVCNIVLDESKKAQAQEELLHKISKKLKPFKEFEHVRVGLQIDTHLDVIARIIEKTKLAVKNGYGKRYGHPILDFARELNRYLYPTLHDIGRNNDLQERIKKQAIRNFSKALGI